MVVENACGRLKGRGRCLLQQQDFKLHNITDIVAACVTLHYFCEISGEEYAADANMIAWNSPNPANSPCNPSITNGATTGNAIIQHLQKLFFPFIIVTTEEYINNNLVSSIKTGLVGC